MEHFNDSSFNSFELQITEAARQHLKTAAGWGLFISITGFVLLGFGLLSSLLMIAGGSAVEQAAMGAMPFSMATAGFSYLLFIVFWMIPLVFLFRFSSKTRNAVADLNSEELTAAFANLKNNFMFTGIVIILSIVGFITMLIMMITLAASMAGGHFN